MKNRESWCLGSWLLSTKGPPSLLLWRESGEEGGGSECIPLSSCPGGVLALAAERGMKASLSPCRHEGLGRLTLCWPNSKQDRVSPGPSLSPSPKTWLTRRNMWSTALILHGCAVQNQSGLWEKTLYKKSKKITGGAGGVDGKHVLLQTKLNSFELFGESWCQSGQGRKGLFHIFHCRCCLSGFSPWLARRQAAGWHDRCNFQLCPFSKRLREWCLMSLRPIRSNWKYCIYKYLPTTAERQKGCFSRK